MDILGEVLRVIRLKGSVYFNACFCSPWGMSIQQDARASFHIVVKGNAWLIMEGLSKPLKLGAGDIVLFPTGSPHTIADHPDSHCFFGTEVVAAYRNNQPLFDGELDDFNIICGYAEFDHTLSHPLIDNLPSFIHIDTKTRNDSYWLDNIIKQIILETSEKAPGSELLIDKFTEILFIQVIRSYAKQNNTELCYISALLDSQLSQALVLMHSKPDHEWSVEGLASQIGMSRSAFYSHFNEMVGTPPMKYLTQWRMMQAKDKLQNSSTPIPLVAEQVGYQSSSAFQKAFKRFFSFTPASLRKKNK